MMPLGILLIVVGFVGIGLGTVLGPQTFLLGALVALNGAVFLGIASSTSESENEASQVRLTRLQTELENNRKTRDDFQSALQKRITENEQLRQELRDSQEGARRQASELEWRRSQNSKEVDARQAECERLRNLTSSQLAEIEQLKAGGATSKAQLEDARSKLSNLRQEYNDQSTRLDSSEEIVKRKCEELRLAQEQLEVAKSQMHAFERRITQLNTEMLDEREHLALDTKHFKEGYEAQLGAMKTQISMLKRSLEGYRSSEQKGMSPNE